MTEQAVTQVVNPRQLAHGPFLAVTLDRGHRIRLVKQGGKSFFVLQSNERLGGMIRHCPKSCRTCGTFLAAACIPACNAGFTLASVQAGVAPQTARIVVFPSEMPIQPRKAEG